ncbi:A kinase (PRKA) anchor protein 1b [Stigmatopora argus]
MPLRFRLIVPYTLPVVLALIGWWWYTSRKKEHLIIHDDPDGGTANTAVRSNGVVEKDTVSTTTNTEHHLTYSCPKISRKDEQRDNISIVKDTNESSLMGQTFKDVTVERRGIKQGGSTLVKALPQYEQNESLNKSLKDDMDPSPPCTSVVDINLRQKPTASETVTDPVLTCQSTKVTHSDPTSVCLSDSERPEPEGEVAKNNTSIMTQDDGFTVIPLKAQRVVSSQFESGNIPTPLHGFNQHILTSTPNSLVLTSKTQVPLTPQEFQVHNSHGNQEDLEVLAAGFITEVISAATQQVLGGTTCPISDRRQQCHRLRLSNHYQVKCDESHKREQVVGNGSFSATECKAVEFNELLQHVNYTQKEPKTGLSQQVADCEPLLNNKLKGDKLETQNLAWSTCQSDEDMSNCSHQHSLFDSQVDVFQVTGLSGKEAPQPRVNESQTSLEKNIFSLMEKTSVDSVCGIKMLDGMDLRNGLQGCEMETDQSGGSDVNSMDSVDSGCTMNAREGQSKFASPSNSELVIWEIEVPKLLVGRLIGKQGRYVSFLKQTSGAKIYISSLPYTQEFQICHIEGMQLQVDKALSLIGKKFKEIDLTNLYAPAPPPLTLPSLPMTSWLLLPSGVTVEVIVVNIVSAGHVFVQQHTHPTYHALRSLDQQMFLCYSQPGTPSLPSPAEVGVICAAPAVEGAWWRAQVITFYNESNEVEIRYVDYGGYDRVKIDSLRQIRSDFVTLPFQGAEVLLDNISPLPGEDQFSSEATTALEEMTRGMALLAQVSNYDNNTGLPLVHLWNMVGEKVISLNRTLVERGLGVWVDSF